MLTKSSRSVVDAPRETTYKPGPGQHDLPTNSIKDTSLGFGKKMLGHYSFCKRKITPGPGDYRPETSQSMG